MRIGDNAERKTEGIQNKRARSGEDRRQCKEEEPRLCKTRGLRGGTIADNAARKGRGDTNQEGAEGEDR